MVPISVGFPILADSVFLLILILFKFWLISFYRVINCSKILVDLLHMEMCYKIALSTGVQDQNWYDLRTYHLKEPESVENQQNE